MAIPIFVSTRETQGQRENDFCFVPDGEIVDFIAMTCSNGTTDDNCGCKRALSGLDSHKATTTMKVAVFDGNVIDLCRLFNKSLKEGGWLQEQYRSFLGHSLDHASKIIEQASKFPVGAVVEYRDGIFTAR